MSSERLDSRAQHTGSTQPLRFRTFAATTDKSTTHANQNDKLAVVPLQESVEKQTTSFCGAEPRVLRDGTHTALATFRTQKSQ